MKKVFSLILTVAFSATSFAQDGSRIKTMSSDINNRIQTFSDYESLTIDEKRAIRAELIYLKDLLDNMGIVGEAPASQLTCVKTNNGRFYPANIETYEIVGDTGYNASYPSAESCKKTLPASDAAMACAKKDNGRFYPSKIATLETVGAQGYNASYPTHESCAVTLPELGAKVTCAKTDNGRFYPVNAETFEILGETGYNASYPNFKSCFDSL